MSIGTDIVRSIIIENIKTPRSTVIDLRTKIQETKKVRKDYPVTLRAFQDFIDNIIRLKGYRNHWVGVSV